MKTPRYHIIIDLEGLTESVLINTSGLNQFITDLAPAIDMHILHGPVVKEGIPENPGVSAFAIIDYSHISIHTFTDNSEALVDIFSCKPFDKDVALDQTLAFFRADANQARTQTVYWG